MRLKANATWLLLPVGRMPPNSANECKRFRCETTFAHGLFLIEVYHSSECATAVLRWLKWDSDDPAFYFVRIL